MPIPNDQRKEQVKVEVEGRRGTQGEVEVKVEVEIRGRRKVL